MFITSADGASKKNKKKKANQQPPEKPLDEGGDVLGHCCVCNVPWDRYIGKKKCGTCQVLAYDSVLYEAQRRWGEV